MCGIAGVFAYREDAPPVDREELLRIREAMEARGPDGAGLWISEDQRVGLAHRRLSILDLSDAGAQPMSTADGRLRITFNGEIYNYRALRKELEAKGYRFRSTSDTEVLLHLYDERGPEMVHGLRGMYALAIWEARAQSLFMARDPLGVKPLYVADDGRTIRFASQVRALLASGSVDMTPDPAGAAGFALWGSVPEPFTLYRSVRSLPAGSHSLFERQAGGCTTRYFDLRTEIRKAGEHSQQHCPTETIASALSDSVRHHLIADVPVGIFLSAGLDSTALAALAACEQIRPVAITLGFREFEGTSLDEVPLAAATAERLGLQHHVEWITRDEFETELPRLLAAMDQPSIDGVNTYFVSRAAAAAGLKVAISGIGGDELFGGYPSFHQVPRLAAKLERFARYPQVGRAVRRVMAPMMGALTSPKYASLVEFGGTVAGAYLLRRSLMLPWEVARFLDPETAAFGLEALATEQRLADTIEQIGFPRDQVTALEMTWYMRNQLLRDADWAAMAHSLEIRVPFVDVPLMRAALPTMCGPGAPAKREVLGAVLDGRFPEVTSRPKTGFTTPVQKWIAEAEPGTASERGLRGWARRVLPKAKPAVRPLVLLSDAFGAVGGIAKFNRDLLAALALIPGSNVVAVTMHEPREAFEMPAGIRQLHCSGSKRAFVTTAMKAASDLSPHVIVVGHINLAALGAALARSHGTRSILVVHGMDAWTPHRSRLVRRSLKEFDVVAGVSQLTLDRLVEWSGIEKKRCVVLPNCIDLEAFVPGPRPAELAERLGVNGRTVLMTLGRLDSRERLKGIDEVLDVMPVLLASRPDLSYLICGDGDDRPRLEAKVRSLGLAERVVFAGHVPEDRKPDYYRLADAYVMPSRGEGFGIVFLEALACGCPVIGSAIDGSRETLLNGQLGVLADPARPESLVAAVHEVLASQPPARERLDVYSQPAFFRRVALLLDSVTSGRRPSLTTGAASSLDHLEAGVRAGTWN